MINYEPFLTLIFNIKVDKYNDGKLDIILLHLNKNNF